MSPLRFRLIGFGDPNPSSRAARPLPEASSAFRRPANIRSKSRPIGRIPNIPGKLTGLYRLRRAEKIFPRGRRRRLRAKADRRRPLQGHEFQLRGFDVLEAFPDYYGDQPPAQKLIWKIVPEFAARMAGLVSGEFDFIVNVPTDQEKVLSGYKG